jgi:hypothetical protein
MLGEGSLFDQLFIFAAVASSPDPAALVNEALESMRQHPLSSLFPAVHFDKEGKAVHRSAAARSRASSSSAAGAVGTDR